MLFRKKIILGVTGSIAAYKSAFLARLLVKAGADVRVVITDTAKNFITPLTLSTLTKNSVYNSFITSNQGEWVNHVELGLWADAIVVAPASANTISHFANGICNSLLDAVYLSSRCPVFIAPAMDLDMWKHGSTLSNISKLQTFGNHIIEPGTGELASGLVGEGRMTEPEEILNIIHEFFLKSRQMQGKKIVITAGPTREKIDPVRFISNHSSGKMGYAIAEELASRGAKVRLISGPVEIKVKNPSVDIIPVISADEMYQAAQNEFADANALIMTAAVADFRPAIVSDKKIKKSESEYFLELESTTDILNALGKNKNPGQILAGFALETDDAKENATKKLKSKNLDFIILNELKPDNPIFGSDYNRIEIGFSDGSWKSFQKQTKDQVANQIADILNELLKND